MSCHCRMLSLVTSGLASCCIFLQLAQDHLHLALMASYPSPLWNIRSSPSLLSVSRLGSFPRIARVLSSLFPCQRDPIRT
ncbi:hypothetical protein BDY21DRAFT_332771 [Lineolata rhizophorae]|uniref:Uncharacterized protein n=1 Tax=Lineolata rhizophorae TaxID=578093 RepID=A0A6A6PCC8_9PEZI|nr:hypothetical protein BDY21DRAFT_332771 [Lineolata rhizophorae]